jgi:hypothetical protein
MFNRELSPHDSSHPMSPAGLAHALVRHGLPVDYAQRAAAEITDHHRDLVDELQAAGMSQSQAATEATHRLGDPRALVKKTVREYQRRYWCARWPVLSFVVAPPLACAVARWLVGAAVILSFRFFGIYRSAEIGNVYLRLGAGYTLGIMMFHVAPVFVAIGFVHWARRAACSMVWIVASGIGVGLFAALQVWFVDEQQFGFTLAAHNPMRWYVLNPWQWFQFALPLAAGLGFHWFLESRSRGIQATEGHDDHIQLAA